MIRRTLTGETISDDHQIRTARSIMMSVPPCLLTTICADGDFYSVPLRTQEAEYHGRSWFIADRTSRTVQNLIARPHVKLFFANASSWLSLRGTASVVDDAAKKDELWNTFTKARFPGGKDDPSVCVIRVVGIGALYWREPWNGARLGLDDCGTGDQRDSR